MTDRVAQLVTPGPVAAAVAKTCAAPDAACRLEEMVVSDRIDDLLVFRTESWRRFQDEVRRVFRDNDYAVLRGFPPVQDGAALLVATLTVGEALRTYRNGKVIKHFKMSPWTADLSHTTRAGEFHTDLNTEPHPPAITAIQCLEPDPGNPRYGVTRIARLRHLLDFVDRERNERTRRFLLQDTVAMLNDRSSVQWSGRVVDAGTIRYHPDTIRAAARRSGGAVHAVEEDIASVEDAATSIATSFALGRGDLLVLSNSRTLHSRGPCSVVFRDFPTVFDSRRVAVLHAHRERGSLYE